LEVHLAGRAVRLGGGRQRAVLGALLAHRGQVVSRDVLIEWIWGGGLPADPVNTLQHYVARLRGLLEPERGPGEAARMLVAQGGGYALLADPQRVDADVFLARAEAGRAHLAGGRPGEALAELDGALALWRGEPFGESAYVGFADAERARLQEAHRSVLEDRFDAQLAGGSDSGLVPDLVEATRRFPTRERLWGQLMLALYRAGRQADALTVYRQAGRYLAEELGLDPGPDLTGLHGRILRQDPALSRAAVKARGRGSLAPNLPVLRTARFGHGEMLDEIAGYLGRRRLVTLVGPGGIGKTRLAVEVAGGLAGRFPDGVRFVRLDTVGDSAMMAATLVAGLGVPEDPAQQVGTRIVEYLRDKGLLVVLDGCDQVTDPLAELLDTVLSQCGGVVVLATSQMRIGLADEIRVTLSGLPIPEDPAGPAARHSPAVELFVDRARLARPSFTADDSELATIGMICAALAGMPLGIELAAGQVTALSLPEILDGITRGRQLPAAPGRPTSDRRASLQAAIDWTLDLLPAPVRRTLAALSLLPGGFTAETAASIAGVSGHDLLTHLTELVERALLQREPGPGAAARHRPLHPIRAAVLARSDPTVTATAEGRLVAHYADLATRADLGLRGLMQRDWLARLDLEHDNARAALDHAIGRGDAGGALRLAGHLSRYWDWRGHVAEANTWLDPLVAATDDLVSGDRALTLVWAAYFAWEHGDSDRADQLATAALDLAQTLAVPSHVGAAAGILGLVARTRGDTTTARAHLRQAHQVCHHAGEHWFAAWAATGLTLSELDHGDTPAAARAQRYALDAFRRLGDRRGEAWATALRALLHQARGEHRHAAQTAGQGLLLAHSVDDDRTVAWTLEILAVSAHATAELAQAVELLAATDARQLRRGAAEPPSKRGDHLDRLIDLEDRLGPDDFAAAWARGRHLDVPDILTAMADESPAS
jgi:predicted ATPase/DNA-binding SARP family transcriptional activator